MRELSEKEIDLINAGSWNSNNSLSATVIRHAGIGAIGGALGGGVGAIAGAVIGALSGFSSYYGND